MIKAEENFDQLSATESDSSTDSQNPFNVYVEMYKKSSNNHASAKLTQLNTRSSNQSTPQYEKVPDSQDLQFSQSSQNESLQQQREQIQTSLEVEKKDSFESLKQQFHENKNQISEYREELDYWTQKHSEIDTQLQLTEFQVEEHRGSGRNQVKKELADTKKDLKELLAKNEKLISEIQRSDQFLEDLSFQKSKLEEQIGEAMQELGSQNESEEEKNRQREQREFEFALAQIYTQFDFNSLTSFAMKVQNEVQMNSYQKSTDQNEINQNC